MKEALAVERETINGVSVGGWNVRGRIVKAKRWYARLRVTRYTHTRPRSKRTFRLNWKFKEKRKESKVKEQSRRNITGAKRKWQQKGWVE